MLIEVKTFRLLRRSLHTSSVLTHQAQSAKSLELINDKFRLKLSEYMSIYEETIGIKEIKLAQDAVLDVNTFYLKNFHR